MVKLKTTVTDKVTEIEKGYEYKIVSAKEVAIEDLKKNKEYDAIRVVLKPTDEEDTNMYSVSLWLSDTSTENSKLGSFISAFKKFLPKDKDAFETNDWIGHTIKVKEWRNKNREIEVIA